MFSAIMYGYLMDPLKINYTSFILNKTLIPGMPLSPPHPVLLRLFISYLLLLLHKRLVVQLQQQLRPRRSPYELSKYQPSAEVL